MQCGRFGGRIRPKTTSPRTPSLQTRLSRSSTRPRLLLTGREGTRYLFGTTGAGRYLLVVLAEAMDGRDYVVTAREMTDTERQAFRRKGR